MPACGQSRAFWCFDRSASMVIALVVVSLLPLSRLAAQQKEPGADVAQRSPLKGRYGGDLVTAIRGAVTSIACDRAGVLWFGSDHGVFAYTDEQFTLFNHYNTVMPDPKIDKVFIDRRNRKWFVSGHGELLYLFDNVKWQVFANRDIGVRFVGAWQTSVCDDPQGNLWLAIEQSGLWRFRDGVFTRVLDEKNLSKLDPLAGLGNHFDTVRAIVSGSQGRLWVLASRVFGHDRLVRFDGQEWTLPQVDERLLPITALSPGDGENEVLIGSNDGLYAWRDGHTQLVVRWPEMRAWEPIWRSPNGRVVRSSEEGLIVIKGDNVGDYRNKSLPKNWIANDAAFDQQDRIWVVGQGGVFTVGGQGLVAFDRASNERFANLTAPMWRDKPVTEIVREKVSDADIHDVLKNPAKYANQKLRIVGNFYSGFEYMNIIDKDGTPLGIWPGIYQHWSHFLSSTGLGEEFDFWGKEGAQATGSRFYANLSNWPPKPKKPTRNVEYLGYLDWGGGFGHMGATERQFNVVECYPTDFDPAKREMIHKAYLKYAASPAPFSVFVDEQTAAARKEDLVPLQGTWLVKAVEGPIGQSDDDRYGYLGRKWVILGDRMTVAARGYRRTEKIRVDASKHPARIDWDSPGIYRLDGNTLTMAWKRFMFYDGVDRKSQFRPRSFTTAGPFGPLVFKLERADDTQRNTLPHDDADTIRSLGWTPHLDQEDHVIGATYADGRNDHAPIADDRLEPLANFPHLELINVHWNRWLLPAALPPLAKCRNLMAFELGNDTKWTNESLAYLTGLSHLEVLSINGPEITDSGLEKLSGLTALRKLTIGNTAATGSGLRHLADSPELTVFSIGGDQLSAGVLENLGKCRKLRSLTLAGSVTDSGILKLLELRQLEELNLTSTALSEAGLVCIGQLSELRVLTLGKTKVTGAGVAQLKNLRKLERLSIFDCEVDTRILTLIDELKSLKRVQLPLNAGTPEQIELLAENRGLSISLGSKQFFDPDIPVATQRLIHAAVKQRWEAEQSATPATRAEMLLPFELSEDDLSQVLGRDAAHAVWPTYVKGFSKSVRGAARELRYRDLKKFEIHIHTAIWGNHHPETDEFVARFPALADAYHVQITEGENWVGQPVWYGSYVIIDGKAKRLSGGLLTAYRRHLYFKPD